MRGEYFVKRVAWSLAVGADGDTYPENYIDAQETSRAQIISDNVNIPESASEKSKMSKKRTNQFNERNEPTKYSRICD